MAGGCRRPRRGLASGVEGRRSRATRFLVRPERHRRQRGSVMRKHIAAFAAALGLAIVGSLANSTAASASAPPGGQPGQHTEWHRLNPDQSNPASEHERLTCLQGRGWSCHYDKVPEPSLNFHWDSTEGDFHGAVVTQAKPFGMGRDEGYDGTSFHRSPADAPGERLGRRLAAAGLDLCVDLSYPMT